MTESAAKEAPRGKVAHRVWRALSSRRVAVFAGTVAASVLFVSVNILSSRFYTRWDFTTTQLYTLSPVTIETLSRLDRPVDVVVFLSRSDPLMRNVRTLLDEYGAHTTLLRTLFADPDQNPAEFVALQQQYGLLQGRTENGRLATEASIVLSAGDQRWFVTTDDIVVFDEDDGIAKPRLEQAVTEGLVNVLGRKKVTVCMTQGHGEPSIDEGGAQGVALFRQGLEANNYEVRAVVLSSGNLRDALAGCELVVIAGPDTPFSEAATMAVRERVDRGASAFVLVGPITDDEGRILDPALSELLSPAGIGFENDLLFEGDEELRLPVGIGGEVFLASPGRHPVTEAFFEAGTVKDRVLVQLAQGLVVDDKALSKPVLTTSETAIGVSNFRKLRPDALPQEQLQPKRRVVAAAFDPEKVENTDGDGPKGPGRLFVVGSASVLWPSTFSDPVLLSTRRFVENAVSWLTEQPSLVTVPEKPGHAAGLQLSEAALDEVQRYVLLYMPLCVALIGGLMVYRRRKELPRE